MEIAIIGKGGFAKEVEGYLKINAIKELNENIQKRDIRFELTVYQNYVSDDFADKDEEKLSTLLKKIELGQNPHVYIAIGDSKVREKIVNFLPKETNYPNLYCDLTYLSTKIGKGNIFCPQTIITSNVVIGNFCHFNLQTSIGHDSVISDFVTTAPKVSISGNNNIGKHVYLGTGASTKQEILICDEAVIGLHSGVVHNIHEKGTYVGTPAYKLNEPLKK